MAKQKLRIGLLVESYSIPSWAFSSIETIIQSDYAEITQIITNHTFTNKKKPFTSKLKQFSFSVFKSIENKLHKPKPNAFLLKPLNSILKDCKSSSSDALNAENLNHLDLIIRLDQNPIPKALLEHVKFGIWSYVFGDYSIKRTGPFGVWELFEGQHDTKVSLMLKGRIVEKDAILYETTFSNDKLYTNRQANTMYWKTADILPRMLENLHHTEPEVFFKNWLSKYSASKIQNNQIYKVPGNYQTLKSVFKLYWKAFVGAIERRSSFEQWILLFQMNTKNERPKTFDDFARILPPKDRIWADPFVIERDNTSYIFIEEFLFNEPYGKIAVIEMDKDGHYNPPKSILEKPYHLSYPFLIEDNGVLYMLPETMGNNTIELYKCANFPYEWTFEKIIMDNIKAVDSTLFKHDNKYWLFTNIEELNGTKMQSELHLFYADSLLSNNWTAHQQNPISTDRSCARPAGNIYVSKNRIFRPAQNCTKHYGYAMKIKEITQLSTTNFEEHLNQSIVPNWSKDMFSTHTINASESLTVIDAKIKRKR